MKRYPLSKVVRPQESRKGPIDNLRRANEETFKIASDSARQELDAIKQKAHEEGFRSGQRLGYEAGKQEGQEKVLRLESLLKSLLCEVGEIKDNLINDTEKEIVLLAVKIATRILKKEVSLDNMTVLEITRAAIEKTGKKEGLRIKINPEEYDLLKQLGSSIDNEFDGENDISLIPDASVLPGGCLIESDFVSVDARIDSQIKGIMEELSGWRCA